jgi:hypothetical protein
VSNVQFQKVDYSSPGHGVVEVEVGLKNRGALPTGVRQLTVMGTAPTLPMLFPGKVKEPQLLREREGGMVLNKTNLYLGPYEEGTYKLSVDSVPGIRLVWVEIDGGIVDGRSLSEPYVAICLPVVESTLETPIIVAQGSAPAASIVVRNRGGCSVADMLPLQGIPGTNGLYPHLPPGDLGIDIRDRSGKDIDHCDVDIMALGPGGSMEEELRGCTDWASLPKGPLVLVGDWGDDLPMTAGVVSPPSVDPIVQVPELPDLLLTRPEVESYFESHVMAINVSNPTDRSLPCLVLVLYDGLPSDAVTVSSMLLDGLGPGENASASLPIHLPEGRYFMTVGSSLPAGSPSEGLVSWIPNAERSGEYIVKNSTVVPPDGNVASDEDTQRALIMAGGIAVLIVVAAISNKAFEESRKEK